MLRFVSGLDTDDLPPVPAREVTPDDVLELMQVMRADLFGLFRAYGIEGEVEPVERPSGMTSTDVYNSLLRIDASLDGLGLPPVVPNDVFRLAETVRGELLLLAGRNGESQDDPRDMITLLQKKPADGFGQARALLEDLKRLADADRRYAVPGGVVIPDDPPDPITPDDVLDELSSVMAEVSAMKVAAGISQPTRQAAFEGGMTPNEVYNSLSLSRGIVAGMISDAEHTANVD